MSAINEWREARQAAVLDEAQTSERERAVYAQYYAELVGILSAVLSAPVARKIEPLVDSDGVSEIRSKARAARDLLTPAQASKIRAQEISLNARMMPDFEALDLHRKERDRAVRRLASEISEPVEGAEWREVHRAWRSSWASQGTGAESYARSSATVRAYELSDVGYPVRLVRYVWGEGIGAPGRLACYAVEIQTSEEGALIARHQRPWSTKQAEEEAWAVGANPGALWSSGLPLHSARSDMSRRASLEVVHREILRGGGE